MIHRSQAGDKKAQCELYKLYAKAMYNICRRMTGNDDDAQDVLQDSFIQAFLNLKKLKNINTFSAWLKRIVINNCINHLKKKRNVLNELDDEINPIDVNDEEEVEFKREEINRVLEAVDQISEGCRTVLNLYVFEGYDHKEIAGILKITESASKAQYSKAKAKIRKLLEHEKR